MLSTVLGKQQMADQDSSVKIKVDEKKMRVIATYIPSLGEGKKLTVEDVRNTLEDRGVKTGIKDDIIAKMVESDRPMPNVVIAEGIQPGIGEKARLETYVKPNKRTEALKREDGSTDYKDLGEVSSVIKDQKLYRKIPSQLGNPGMDVLGNEIPGLPGKDFKLATGPGTAIDKDDPDLVVAAKAGEVLIVGGIMQIAEVHTVKGDVDYETGNVNYKGSVVIGGAVKSGFSVEADGNIEIHGNVQDAEVVSKNDVIVKGGCAGAGNGKIRAGGDISIKFVENQTLTANRDIIIDGNSYHAKMFAGRSILGKGHKSMIVGGSCEAKLSIETAQLGSVACVSTIIKVGIDPKMAERIKQTDDEIGKTKDSQDKIEKSVIFLYKMKIDGKGKLPPDKAQLLAKLEDLKNTLPEKLEALEKYKTKLLEDQKEVQNSYVIATGAVYPKVKVYIGSQHISIDDNLGPSQFRLVEGDIVRLSI